VDNTFDKLYYHKGKLIGGVDESGVSDIAGPLVAACVILPKIDLHKDDLRIFEINDSKKIPEKYRKQHAEVVWQSAIAIGIGEVQPAEIDYLGRESSISLAMVRAVSACKTTAGKKPTKPDFLLVDGAIPVKMGISQKTILHADSKSLCVAAASVVAKVYRDEIMIHLHDQYPYYDWVSNKGFPCEEHFKGLDKHGVQIGIHRTQVWPFRARRNMAERQIQEWADRRALWKRLSWQKLEQRLKKPKTTEPQSLSL
jgi:ribonuclease HII